MDVTIKFLPTEEDPMGRVERIATPLNTYDEVDHWRAGFASVDYGKMAFRMERGIWRDGSWVAGSPYDYLVEAAHNGELYMTLLDTYVAYITIDGMTYWANSTIGKADGE